MQRWKNGLVTITIALNCLLLFLLIFESRLVLPAWLQVVGRMHPLLLHFPVACLVLYALSSILRPWSHEPNMEHYKSVMQFMLLLAAFTSVLTALMGLFLSREQGYDPEALAWHKWSGVLVSFFTLGWYYFGPLLGRTRLTGLLTSVVGLSLIVFAGHQGSGITHGQNFLLAPMLPEKKERFVSPEEAIVYADLVQPILEEKCESCHNSKKAKGQLIMETEALLLKGGKNGLLWDLNAPDLGLLLRRVHLPIEQKKHMPPQGKPQLTDDEIEIITQWIRKGASFKLRVAELPQQDTLRQLAETVLRSAETASYDFDAADPDEVKKLNTVNRIVTEEALQSPALTVSFFNSQLFEKGQLKDLLKVKKQIVSLDLAKMPVTDADIPTIVELENLRRLNLSFTQISGASLANLKKLKFLRSLSLSGTNMTASDLKQLQGFPALQTVYTWNTKVTATELAALQSQNKNLHFESGFRGDTVVLKLSPPVLQNDESIITQPVPLKLKHFVAGASIRYTLDGTEPDSLHSLLFKGNEVIDDNVLVRAKAFKPGWISSDILEANFYKSGHRPDSVIFLTQPDPSYKGNSKLLIDLVKGETNFRNGNWMAWRQTKMEVLLQYLQAVTTHSVTLSTLTDVGGYIMPPVSIEVWGGEEEHQLKLLGRVTPSQPDKVQPSALRGYEVKFSPTKLKWIKLVAVPVSKLPAWHPGKGDKGWVFVDEILVN